MALPTPVAGLGRSRFDQIWNTPIPAGSVVCAVPTPEQQVAIVCCPEASGELRFVGGRANCLVDSGSAAGFTSCLNKHDEDGADYTSSVCTSTPQIVSKMSRRQVDELAAAQSRYSESAARNGFTSPIIKGGPAGQLSQATMTALPGKPDPIPGVDFDPLTGEPIAVADNDESKAKAAGPGAAPASAAPRSKRAGTALALAALAFAVVTM